jgi:hypothetical protein
MAVIHEQPDMYDFLVDMCGASVHVANHAGLTPLVLGAHMGKFQMFKHITSRRRRPFYSFGRVSVGWVGGGYGKVYTRGGGV